MLTRRRRTRKSKADSWKTWNAVVSEGRKINKQFSRDSRQITAKMDELIALITDTTAA